MTRIQLWALAAGAVHKLLAVQVILPVQRMAKTAHSALVGLMAAAAAGMAAVAADSFMTRVQELLYTAEAAAGLASCLRLALYLTCRAVTRLR